MPVRDVQRRPLMRVLAVAQHLGPLPRAGHPARETARLPVHLVVGRDDVAEPAGHGDVVGRGVPERRRRQRAPGVDVETARLDGRQHVAVAGRIDDDGDRAVVLRRRAHHRRAADVDLLDDLGRRRARGDRGRRTGTGSTPPAGTCRCRAWSRCRRARRRPGRPAGRRGCAGAASSPARPGSRGSRSPRRPASPGCPCARIVAAVEPVDTISTPAACRPGRQHVQPGLVVHADQRAPDGDLGHRRTPCTVGRWSRRTTASRRLGRAPAARPRRRRPRSGRAPGR